MMAFELFSNEELKRIIEDLDKTWEGKLIDQVPFPIAYSLNRLRNENYDWNFLLRDTLSSILKYLALVAINEYLQASIEPDYELNEEIKAKITRPVPEGTWFNLYKKCVSKVGTQLRIPELLKSYNNLEGNKDFEVQIAYPRYEKRIGSLGLLQALIFLRNRDVHGPFLEKDEKQSALPHVIGILRAILFLLEPVLKYEYCQRIKEIDQDYFLLQGITNFNKIEHPAGLLPNTQNFLRNPETKDISLVMFPLVLAEKEKKGSLGNLGELYLLNYLTKSSPEYEGLAVGVRSKKEYLRYVLSHFKLKRVFEKKTDVELESLEEYALQKGRQKLEFLKKKKLYDPEHFVRRKDFEEKLSLFLDSDKNIFLIFGKSGCGKTSALCHFTEKQLQEEQIALIFRCETLAPVLSNPVKLEEYILSELGYSGRLETVLEYFWKTKRKFVLVFDGLNEFFWTNERIDSSHLFLAINQLITNLGETRSLKVIISSRVESKIYMLKEDESVYSFVSSEKYFVDQITGKPFYKLGEFSENELVEAMAICGLKERTREIIKMDKKGKLKNPFLFNQFIETVAKGLKVKKISENRIIGNNIRSKIEDKKTLSQILDKLIWAMDKLKDMNPTLDRLKKKVPTLYKKLAEDNWNILSKLEQSEMIKVQEIYGEGGIPSRIITYNHDKIFKFMKRRQSKKYLIRSFMFSMGIIILFIALGIWGSILVNNQRSEIEIGVSEVIQKIEGNEKIVERGKKIAIELLTDVNGIALGVYRSNEKSIWRAVLLGSFGFAVVLVIVSIFSYIINSITSRHLDFRASYLKNKLREEYSKFLFIILFVGLIIIIALARLYTESLFTYKSLAVGVFFVLTLSIWTLYVGHRIMIKFSSVKLLHIHTDKKNVKILSMILIFCLIIWSLAGAALSLMTKNLFNDLAIENQIHYELLKKIISKPTNLKISEQLLEAGIIKKMLDTMGLEKRIESLKKDAVVFPKMIIRRIIPSGVLLFFIIVMVSFGYHIYLLRKKDYFEDIFARRGIV